MVTTAIRYVQIFPLDACYIPAPRNEQSSVIFSPVKYRNSRHCLEFFIKYILRASRTQSLIVYDSEDSFNFNKKCSPLKTLGIVHVQGTSLELSLLLLYCYVVKGVTFPETHPVLNANLFYTPVARRSAVKNTHKWTYNK